MARRVERGREIAMMQRSFSVAVSGRGRIRACSESVVDEREARVRVQRSWRGKEGWGGGWGHGMWDYAGTVRSVLMTWSMGRDGRWGRCCGIEDGEK